MLVDELVWVRGAGELGSAIGHLLHRVGFHVFFSEISPPLAIRRPVTFSDAIITGRTTVEGVDAYRTDTLPSQETKSWDSIPVFEDNPDHLKSLAPSIIVDARMIKQYEEDYRSWSDLTIGLGPGFDTRTNCHFAIETMRGHNLGRIISSGAPQHDTGIPGNLGGQTLRRIIRATNNGNIEWAVDFGDLVTQGQHLGFINQRDAVLAPTDGIVRGLISSSTPVTEGMKIGDVDPRGKTILYEQISEKARAIAAGVFEAIVLQKVNSADD